MRKLNSAYGRSDGLPKSFGFAKLYNRSDKRYMLERAVKLINKNMTQRVPITSTTFCKHSVITIFVQYSIHEREPFSFVVKFFFFFFLSSLVRNGLNADWFLVNSHYKRLCANLCTFKNVQKIKVG